MPAEPFARPRRPLVVESPHLGGATLSKIQQISRKGEADVPECECERRFQAQLIAVMPNWLMTLINLAGAATVLVLLRL